MGIPFPCVLPVLPILLAGGASGRRPLGIIVGLVGSRSWPRSPSNLVLGGRFG